MEQVNNKSKINIFPNDKNSNEYNRQEKNTIIENKNKNKIKIKNTIQYNGFIFRTTSRTNYYNKNTNKIIYKCIYNSHKEKERNLSNLGAFCNTTIETFQTENKISYILKIDYSLDCYEKNSKKIYKYIKNNKRL